MNVTPVQGLGAEYLRLDTFLDASQLPTPASAEIISDSRRIVKVGGWVTVALWLYVFWFCCVAA